VRGKTHGPSNFGADVSARRDAALGMMDARVVVVVADCRSFRSRSSTFQAEPRAPDVRQSTSEIGDSPAMHIVSPSMVTCSSLRTS
jgi:hypothetical protein